MSDKYRILSAWVVGGPAQGVVLEQYRGHDYGMVRDEERGCGAPCVALASGQEEPLFYVFPLSHIEPA